MTAVFLNSIQHQNSIAIYLRQGFMILVCLCTYLIPANGQIFTNRNNTNSLTSDQKIISDSTSKKQLKTDDKVVISYFTFQDTLKRKIDTSIQTNHRNPMQRIWHVDLGNLGTTNKSLKFESEKNVGFQLGLTAMKSSLFNPMDAPFYNTTRPYTDLYYRIGTKQEQILDVLHTQNVLPKWNISAHYRKAGSPGFFKQQKTNHDNFVLNSTYRSDNDRYDLKFFFGYNKFQQDENGGVVSEEDLLNQFYRDRRTLPVAVDYSGSYTSNKSSISNYYRQADFIIEHQYSYGKHDSIWNADSTSKINLFKPIVGIKHRFYYQNSYYRYKDLLPDSSFYKVLGINEFVSRDSLQTKYFTSQLGNMFSLNGTVRIKDKILTVEAGYGFEIDHPNNVSYKPTYLNNFIFGQMNKSADTEHEWFYNANARFYFSGINIGNFLLDAKMGKQISEKIGAVKIGFRQTLQSAPYIFQSYENNYFYNSNSFSKQSITKLSFEYSNPRVKTQLGLNYFLVGNYFYRDTTLLPQQYTKVFPLLQLTADKQFHVRNWVLDNHFLVQLVSNQTPLHLPVFASRHRLAYENFILKKKLQVATGIEMRYNSPYYADNYSPIFMSFVSQYQRQISNYPQWSYFFNFKVKRFRAFVSLDELQQLVTINNINYSYYPGQNFGFRFGFNWVFIN